MEDNSFIRLLALTHSVLYFLMKVCAMVSIETLRLSLISIQAQHCCSQFKLCRGSIRLDSQPSFKVNLIIPYAHTL